MLNSVYSPRSKPSNPKLTSWIDKPMVGTLTFASNSPARAGLIFDRISFLTKDPKDLRVGVDLGNRASYRSDALKFGTAKLMDGMRSSENWSSGRYFFTSNTSNEIGSIGIPDTLKPEKRSNKLCSSAFTFSESNILKPISYPKKLGPDSMPNENVSASTSEKVGAKPNATAMCGRNMSTAES